MIIHAIDIVSPYVWIFAFGIFLRTIWVSYLRWRNRTYILENDKTAVDVLKNLHEKAAERFTRDKLDLALLYERTSEAFALFKTEVFRNINRAAFLLGLTPTVMYVFMHFCGMNILQAVICGAVLWEFMLQILMIPFDYYDNFKLEDKFGFNMMTIKTFITDNLKTASLTVVITCVKMSVVYGILHLFHSEFGLFTWKSCLLLSGILMIFGFIVELVYMKLIIPLFNKLTPMEDSPLKTRMETMMKNYGFNPSGVFIIDASRRSKHSNAYCSGWGKNKKLVLFDTLLKNMSDDEIMSILGHELAHSKLWHLAISRGMDFIHTFIFLFVSSFFLYDLNMYHAFGFTFVNSQADAIAYSMFGFWIFDKIFDSYIWIFNGIESMISRKMEFAADAYSCKYNNGNIEPMITSLFKLYDENLSYPLCDPLYESWNYDHPGLINRITAFKTQKTI